MSNIDVWLDEWEIQVGDSITPNVSQALDDCALVVVMLSTASVRSGWVEKEWSCRFGDEVSSGRVHVLPVLIEDCKIPALLRDKRCADMRHNYSAGLRELIESVRRHGWQDAVIGPGARIRFGRFVYERVEPNVPLMKGMINTIERGCFIRAEGRLQAHLHTVGSHQDFQSYAERTGMNRLILTSSDYVISNSLKNPSRFVGRGVVSLPLGQQVCDFRTSQLVTLSYALRADYKVEVMAHCSGGEVVGTFEQVVAYEDPCPISRMVAAGPFTATIEVE